MTDKAAATEAAIRLALCLSWLICLQQREAHLRGDHDTGLGVEAFLGRTWGSGT